VPISAAQLAGSLVENLVAPVLTKDQVFQAMEDVLPKPRTEDLLDMSDLDIVPTSMDKVAFEWLHRFREGGHFTLVEGYH
jgi:NADH dehydrogenase (ubiquinone) 1 alpha subcomplex subunit 9